MVEEGTREIVFVAQDTAGYGGDLEPPHSLAKVIHSLRTMAFDGWLRVMYMHPDRLDEELITAIGEHMMTVNYFDVPLQHVSSTVLASMARSGGPEEYLQLIDSIRLAIPDASIRTTFLLGYPGETERDFQQLIDFIADARLDRVACFAYSAQDNTPAALLPDQVPPEVASERVDLLMAAQEMVSLEANRRFEGQRLRVLLESQDERTGDWVGRSYRDAPEVDGQVLLTGSKTGQAPELGEFTWAVIEEALVHDLRGRIA